MTEIVPIPKLRKEIKDAAENKELAIFIGAGVSRLYGCDSWDSLASRLVEVCFNSKSKKGKNLITFKEKEYLLNERNRKKVITICKNLFYEADLENKYHDCLKEGLLYDKVLPQDNIYDYLFRMGFGGIYLTTNADSHFSHKFENRLAYKLGQLMPKKIDRSYLYHLHGSIEDPDSLIFTVPEYLKHYNSDNKQYLKFLKEIFLKYTVLFVGYGLDELEVLEFMAAKTNLDDENPYSKRFLLFPLYKGEENILRNERTYFKSFGIELIAFEKDQSGYGQLIEVIKTWSSEIDQTSSVLVDNYKEIEHIANNFNNENSKRILHLITHDKSRELHFFNAIVASNKPSDWLKFLKDKRYFVPENSPEPIESSENKGYFSIPHWHVLNYLEAVATENELHPNNEITKIIKKIIKENCEYIRKKDAEKRNYRTEWIMLKIIGKLPLDEIAITHIKYIYLLMNSYWDTTLIASEMAKNVFSKIMKVGKKEIVLELFKVIISMKLKPNSWGGDFVSVLDEYWLNELLEKNIEEFSTAFPLECLDILIRHIDILNKKKSGMFGTVWIPDIEGKKNDFPEKYQVQLIFIARKLIDAIQDKNQVKSATLLLERRKSTIIKRLLFYCYTKNFQTFKTEIWKKIATRNPLVFYDGKREVYNFLLENAEFFNEVQIKKILGWIEKIKFKNLDEKLKRARVEAYAKKEWLSALISSKNKLVTQRYKEYDSINPANIDHPGYSSWMESGWVSHSSPYKLEDLKSLSVIDLVKKIESFKEEKSWKRNAPSREGLANTLEVLVEDDPAKFIDNIQMTLKLDPYYLYHFFLGIKKASNEKLIFSWNNLLSSILNHIKNEFKWAHEEDDSYSYSHAYLKEFFSFLAIQINNSDSGIESSLEQIIEEILIYSLNHYVKTENLDKNDVVTLSINTLPGILFETTITYLLWIGKNKFKNSDIKWSDSFKDIFNQKLDSPNRDREYSATLGKFFRNILYLDSKWVWNNFDKILPVDNDLFWNDTMSALLFYMSNVYDEIYKKLKNDGHYIKALETEFYSEDINRRVIEHICVAYLFGLEKFDGSLLKVVIEKSDISLIKKIIWFFSRRDIKNDHEKEQRIGSIWSKLFSKYKNSTDNESKKIILALASLQKHFDSLKPNMEMLKLAFKYCSLEHYPFEPFEIIQKYVENEAGFVGELILCSVEGEFYFSYKEDVLQSVIEKMYLVSENEMANKICIAYLHKGIQWPREIYEKYNK